LVFLYVYILLRILADMNQTEIANQIFSIPKWYASIPKRGFTDQYLNAQTANRIKKRFKDGTLSDKMIEIIFNHYGYFIADKTWIRK
jgi:hypothetical protein